MQIARRIYRRTVPALAAACLLSTPVLAHPGSGIAVDRLGQVYFLDTGAGLWKIDARGKLAQYFGNDVPLAGTRRERLVRQLPE